MLTFHIEPDEIRPVYPEWYNQVYAVEKLGWRWMSWIGTPVKGTLGYSKKQRVRQLLSPKQLECWKRFLAQNEGRKADGSEPLSYAHCSSGGGVELVPDLVNDDLAVNLSRCVHDSCESVPHDIGLALARIVKQHLDTVLE